MNVSTRAAIVNDELRQRAPSAKLTPFELLVLVAIHESDHGEMTTLELEWLFRIDGSAIRSALLRLYGRGYAIGVGADGGQRRRGIRTLVKTTRAGDAAAGLVVGAVRYRERRAGEGGA